MGGSSGGGEQYVPVEEPDNLKSKQILRVLHLLCEGEIEGPVGGLKGVKINGTRIQNDDGSYNFSGVRAVWTNGTQHQSPLSGFNGIRNEVSVGVELKAGQAITRTITDPHIDRLRLTVGVQGLMKTEDNGDIVGTSVRMSVQVKRAGTWVTEEQVEIRGKTRSQYLRAVVIDNLPAAPFDFRVVRDTPDSDSSRLVNKTIWQGYTEIMDEKLSYPNTAIAGIEVDSSQFQGVPTFTALMRCRRIKVPSNYDPITREYTGLWDGRFKIAWSNNPAWVFYDLATCKRAGIGRRLGEHQVDKWALYQVAQYCDQLVDDGFGGKEPRMTCNVVIHEQQQAYSVFSSMASIFRAMPIWTGTQFSVSMDAPADPVYQYNNANVVDGKFSYQSSGKKARHTAVTVDYRSPEHGYETRTEYVSDDDMIARYGLNIANIEAFACTSRGQARRAGRWLLETEKREKHTVTFQTYREGLKHAPGDVIQIADQHYAGARIGGRVKSVNLEEKRVKLDGEVYIPEGEAFFSYFNETGKVEKIRIFSAPKPDELILDEVPYGLKASVPFTVSTQSLAPRLFRCVSLVESEGIYTVTALEFVPQKHAIVENGLVFDPPNGTLLGGTIPPVEHLQVEDTPEEADKQVRLTWSTPRVIQGIQFEVKLTRAGAVVFRKKVDDTELSLGALKIGDYRAEVRGMNAVGQVGPATTVAFTISPPSVPVRIDFTVDNFSVTARPVIEGPTVVGTEYEWYFGTTREQVETRQHSLGRAFILNHQGRKPDTVYWYGVEAVNAQGRSGLLVAQTKTLLRPSDILDLIGPEIPKLDWMEEIIQKVGENASGLLLLKDRAALVVNKDGKVSGMTVTAEDVASAIDILADVVSFTNPTTLERDLYWDSNRNTLVVKGEIKLLDGHTVGSLEDIRAQDGDTIFTEFQFSADKVNWHFPEREGDIYLRSRTVTNGNAGGWGNVTNLKGDKGDDATERYTWIKYADSPAGSGMSDNPSGKAYMGIAYNQTSPTESTNPNHYVWSKIKGETGQDGKAGAGVFRLQTSTGVFPSDTAVASSLFHGHVGRDPVLDDVLTVYAVDSAGVVTQADSRMFDGSRWVTPKLFVDGDVIALGTVRGEHIVAGVELRSPRINTGELRGGDAGFGAGGPYKGYRTFIHSDGRIETNYLDAKGGTLDNLTINSKAVFKGRLEGASGNFSGKVSAAQVEGAKVLLASGSVKIRDVVEGINTGYRAGSWGDNKRTYIVELATTGSVTTSNTSAAKWGAFVRNNPYIMTPWSGGATVHFDAEARFVGCWPESNFGINWKLWELL